MREQVINGKLYSTDLSEPLAGHCSSFANTDPRHYVEVLYRKHNGEYFLYCWGGPQSKYANAGLRRGDNSRIIVVSPEEARLWCKKYGSPRAYATIWTQTKI